MIIPVRHDPRLEACLEALAHQSLDPRAFEVLVISEARDAAMEQLAVGSGARYLVQAGGAYAARAAGIAAAGADVLAFTDADAIVPPGWVAALDVLFRDPTCQAVTGPSSSASDTRVAAWIQAVDEGRWARVRDVEDHAIVETRNLAIRRDILERNPFDASFTQAGDLDLGIRLQRAGVRIRVVEGLRVLHQHPESLRALVSREIRRGRGLARLERKHGRVRPPQGDRSLRVGGLDLKAALLAIARRPGWRWLAAGASSLVIAALLPPTWVFARLPEAGGVGLRTFVALERASLLLGRSLGPRDRR